jgi:cell division septum initiation protein DivIVA
LSDLPSDNNDPLERENELLRRELAEAHTMNRGLLRQLKKAQESAAEASRAHAKMVATLTETMRENTALSIECDMWKARALKTATSSDSPQVQLDWLNHQITEDEANAIRKAMARLHHPDAGGDAERMKLWNAALDRRRMK